MLFSKSGRLRRGHRVRGPICMFLVWSRVTYRSLGKIGLGIGFRFGESVRSDLVCSEVVGGLCTSFMYE